MSFERIVTNSALASGLAAGDGVAQRQHQSAGGGVQHEPHLIGNRAGPAAPPYAA